MYQEVTSSNKQNNLNIPFLEDGDKAEQPVIHSDAEENDNDENRRLKEVFTFKQSFKESWKNSFPLILSRIFSQGAAFWGMKLLAQSGEDYNAAEQSIGSIQILVILATTMPFIGTNQFISAKFHHDQEKGKIINDVIASGIYGVVIATPTVIGLSYTRNVLRNLQQPESVIGIAGDYFDIFRYIVISIIASNSSTQILTALQDNNPTAIANLLGAIAGVIGQYAFIEGEFGQSPDSVRGLAKALAIQSSISSSLLLIYLAGKLIRHPEWRSEFSPKVIFESFLKHFRFGFLLDIMTGMETGAIFAMSSLVGKYMEVTGLSDFNVITQYFNITVPIQIALRQVATAAVGRQIGRKAALNGMVEKNTITMTDELDQIPARNANRSIYAGITNSVIISTLQLVLCVSATEAIVRSFMADDASDEEISDMRLYFAIACIAQLFDGVRNMYSAGMTGHKNLLFPCLVSLVLILGASVGFSALALSNGTGLAEIFGINLAAVAMASVTLGVVWHKKDLKTFKLTYDKKPGKSNAAANAGEYSYGKTRGRLLEPANASTQEDVFDAQDDVTLDLNAINSTPRAQPKK